MSEALQCDATVSQTTNASSFAGVVGFINVVDGVRSLLDGDACIVGDDDDPG